MTICGGHTIRQVTRFWTTVVIVELLGVGPLTAQICNENPVIIATGNAQNYSFTKKADGVLFDIDADGVLDQVAWTEPDSEVAFLAIDRNGNGIIDNGSELFGNHTLAGSKNGFAALRNMVGNGDGKVSQKDALFANLLLWHDRNHNGISEPVELTHASELLEAIGLGYTLSAYTLSGRLDGNPRRDDNGNQYRLEGWARKRESGKPDSDRRGENAVRTEAARGFRIYDVCLVK